MYCQPSLLQATRIQYEHSSTRTYLCINRIFQFQYPNIIADRMGTYIKFKGEITNGIALPFI